MAAAAAAAPPPSAPPRQQQHQPLLLGGAGQAPEKARPSDKAAPRVRWTARAWLGVAIAAVEVLASVAVLLLYGLPPTVTVTGTAELRALTNGEIMMFPAVVLELSYVLSASGTRAGVQLHGYQMSIMVLVQYAKKWLCYIVMANSAGGIVHANMRAVAARGCYTLRFMDWVGAVPLYAAVTFFPLIGNRSFSEFAWMMTPNSLLTSTYTFASWVAIVTPSGEAGWALLALATVGWLMSVIDQWALMLELATAEIRQLRFKLCVLVGMQIVFAVYGTMFVLSIFDVVSSTFEQLFYTYGDVIIKVVQAAVLVIIRNFEDLQTIEGYLEAQVQMGKENMSRLIRKANAPILLFNVDGQVTGWNDTLARISHVSAEEAVGRPLEVFVHEDCRASLLNAVQACRQGLSTPPIELLLHPGKKQSEEDAAPPVQLVMNFVMQLGGDSSSVVGVGQDLTELVEIKALQARRAVFTAVIGHELRSPLHGIMGLSSAMAETSSDTMQKRQLNMIRGCAMRLLDLVTNIMEMVKNERDLKKSEVLQRNEVNLMNIVNEVIQMTTIAVDKAGKPLVNPQISIVNNMCTGTIPLVRGDPYKITQLVYNLLTNACKFTSQGTVSFNFRHNEEQSWVEFDVADTGVGISKSGLARIFEPFEQEHGKDARSFQGVGLGLSVAKAVVTLHGGSISVQSALGVGTTFTVRLPCDNSVRVGLTNAVTCEDPPLQPQSAPQEKAGARSNAKRPLEKQMMVTAADIAQAAAEDEAQPKLLLSVDDDDVNQEVIDRTLGSQYRIVRAMNGMEALAYLTSGQELPSIVLLDVMMPGITGFKVCSEIRTKLNFRHLTLPVIMLSARSPYEDTALESYRCGATDHMQKPFSASMLKMRLGLLARLQLEHRALELKCGASDMRARYQLQAALPHVPEGPPEEETREALRRALAERDEVQARLEVLEAARQAAQCAAEKREEAQAQALARVEGQVAAAHRAQAAAQSARPPPRPVAAASGSGKLVGVEPGGRGAAALVEREPAAGTPAALPAPGELLRWQHRHDGTTGPSPLQQELGGALRDVDFLRAELEVRDRQVADLVKELKRAKADAWMRRHRLEATERELDYERSRRRQWCGDTSPF